MVRSFSFRPRFWQVAALIPLSSVATAQPPASPHASVPAASTWTFHHEHVLGTSLTLAVHAASEADARRAEEAALRSFDRDEALLSTWRPESEVSRWARTRFQPVRVSPELFAVLAAFDSWRERTGGALDASVEVATRLWQRAAAENRKPTPVEIASTIEAMQQPHWSLDPAKGTATRLSEVPLALSSFTKSIVISRAADAALASGARGVMVNAGGDIVVRGALSQWVDIADPTAPSENDVPLTHMVLHDRAIATSGSYRRGFTLAAQSAESSIAKGPTFSHLFDPRTAHPAAGVLSSTVAARDAETAGALATAFSVLTPAESERVAASFPDVEYLLVLADGRTVGNAPWPTPAKLRPAAYAPLSTAPAGTGLWNPAFELTLKLTLPRIADARYRRPYVAVWIEDADHVPVRTLALWTQNPRWLPDLKQWYRDDQLRTLAEGTDISRTVASATRPPGEYTLKWDGKDNAGKPVKAGRYSVLIEAAREHGGYDLDRHDVDFNGKPQQIALPETKELGAISLDYHQR